MNRLFSAFCSTNLCNCSRDKQMSVKGKKKSFSRDSASNCFTPHHYTELEHEWPYRLFARQTFLISTLHETIWVGFFCFLLDKKKKTFVIARERPKNVCQGKKHFCREIAWGRISLISFSIAAQGIRTWMAFSAFRSTNFLISTSHAAIWINFFSDVCSKNFF